MGALGGKAKNSAYKAHLDFYPLLAPRKLVVQCNCIPCTLPSYFLPYSFINSPYWKLLCTGNAFLVTNATYSLCAVAPFVPRLG